MRRTHAQTPSTPERSPWITAVTKRTYQSLSKIRTSFRAEKTTRTLTIWVKNLVWTPIFNTMVGPMSPMRPS